MKHRISQEWEQEIAVAFLNQHVKPFGKVGFLDVLGAFVGPKKWDGFQPGKMRVTVERQVPSARQFIRDDDNLWFSVKPLLDALKRDGYIKNDSRKWLEHPTPTQQVSVDGQAWTVVTIEAVASSQVEMAPSKTLVKSQPQASVVDEFAPEVLPRSPSSSLAGLYSSPEFNRTASRLKHG